MQKKLVISVRYVWPIKVMLIVLAFFSVSRQNNLLFLTFAELLMMLLAFSIMVMAWSERACLVAVGAKMALRDVSGQARWREESPYGLFHMAPLTPKDKNDRVVGFASAARDHQARKEADRRVRQLNEDLECRTKEMEAFVHSVSHDLRAPLRAINGFSQIIASRYESSLNEEARHYFHNIITASKQMERLIEDMLAFARVGHKALRLERLPLRGLVEEIEVSLGCRIMESDAQVTYPQDLPAVYGDRTLLLQILTNLINNALIYHRPGVRPQVTISCRCEPGVVVIAVADKGLGIRLDQQEKIFEAFHRAHCQDVPGSGLGLAIVRKSVELLCGRVWVESVVGEGSTFYVKLPERIS